jgi:hypothetical protein
MAAAQRIMAEHSIQAEALNLDGAPEEPTEELRDYYGDPLDAMSARMEPWRWSLAHSIASASGCFCFTSRKYHSDGLSRTIEIVGRPSAVETVRYLYGWIARELVRLVEEHGRGAGRVWRREFLEGGAQEIGRRLREANQAAADSARAAASTSTALVRVETAIIRVQSHALEAKAFAYRAHGLRSGRGGGYRQHNGSAREAGAAAARGISLNRSARQIGGGR